MNKEETKTLGGSNNEWKKAVNKNLSDSTRRIKISARIDKPLLEKIEQKHSNRSKAIREALRREYSGGQA